MEYGIPSSLISKTAGHCCCCCCCCWLCCSICCWSDVSRCPPLTPLCNLLDVLGPLECTAVLVGRDSVNTRELWDSKGACVISGSCDGVNEICKLLDVTQYKMDVCYRCFETFHLSHVRGLSSPLTGKTDGFTRNICNKLPFHVE